MTVGEAPALSTGRRVSGRVVVVGSINADIIAFVEERPTAGRTVLATRTVRRSGGKGANQAASSGRTGVPTVLIAAVGDDAEADVQLADLVHDGVDVSRVVTAADTATGLALITVTPDGENSITVAPGANAALTAEAVLALLPSTEPSVVVLQTEVSADVIEAVVGWCASAGVRVILNDGPCVPLSSATLAAADPLVVNEHEARDLCRLPEEVAAEELAGAVVRATGARSVVVTMGPQGSVVADGSAAYVVPAERVDSVADTTGAGDAFLGTLAAMLVAGMELRHAVHRAAAAAAVSVTWQGARPPRD